jgi:hypothetical protein
VTAGGVFECAGAVFYETVQKSGECSKIYENTAYFKLKFYYFSALNLRHMTLVLRKIYHRGA